MENNKHLLLDGRIFWTTDNGFTYWVKSKTKGIIAKVSQEYYNSLIRRFRLEKSKKYKRRLIKNNK